MTPLALATGTINYPATETINHPVTETISHPATETINYHATETNHHPTTETINNPATETIDHPATASSNISYTGFAAEMDNMVFPIPLGKNSKYNSLQQLHNVNILKGQDDLCE